VETNTNYIISVKDLIKEYNDGKVTALSHCNLDVKKGEVVAIIGPSGSGKSTLLRSLNLLEEPTSGEIFFEGVNLASSEDGNGISAFQSLSTQNGHRKHYDGTGNP